MYLVRANNKYVCWVNSGSLSAQYLQILLPCSVAPDIQDNSFATENHVLILHDFISIAAKAQETVKTAPWSAQ